MNHKEAISDSSVERNLNPAMVASYKELETQALEMLLNGDSAVIGQLRLQWSLSAKECEFTGVGFFTRFEVPLHIARTSPASFKLGDVDAWISGIQIGLLLSVREGMLSWFEAYTYQEPWPETPVIERILYRNATGSHGDQRDQACVPPILKLADQ